MERAAEVHYSVAEVADRWQLSADVVRELFRNEPGVLKLERPAGRFKRCYTTLRIPESVLSRVHNRLSQNAESLASAHK
jgi:hypothetical protein